MKSSHLQNKILNVALCFAIAGIAIPTISREPVFAQNSVACNCVLYARTLVPSLPRGLFTLQNKKNIINSYTPSKGAVAIIDSGLEWGHVAVVTDVSPDGTTVTIQESNWRRCRIGSRTGSPQRLNILGYFQP
jgi:hypothetical protein